MTHLLSKSKYIRGLQCERALWLDVHEPRLARYTAEQIRRLNNKKRMWTLLWQKKRPIGRKISDRTLTVQL